MVSMLRTGFRGSAASSHGKDRFGQALAGVYVNGVDVADILIAEGFGRGYHGTKRRASFS